MDSLKQSHPKVHKQLLSHNSKRTIKFMASFSLLCVLFSLLPLLFQSFKPFLMQFFTYTIGKSYMFLLCNSLLVFIAMNSGLMNGFSPTTHQRTEVTVDSERSTRVEFNVSEIAAPVEEAENVMEIVYPQPQAAAEEEEEEEEENSLMIVGQEDVDGLSETQQGEEVENALMIIDNDEDEHGAEDTEELNKKCEDFIRKMKAAFNSEPTTYYYYNSEFDNQKALVVVN